MLQSLHVVLWICVLIAYHLCFAVFTLLQRLIWMATGVASAPKGKSARVLSIMMRYKHLDIDMANLKHFWTRHESFQDPDVLLRHPSVRLYCIGRTHAVFVQLGSSDAELAHAHPFYYAAQFRDAQKVIVVPIEDFHRVAKAIGMPRPLSEAQNATDDEAVGDVIMLYSTGRCGSTLLTQMLESLPNTLSLSEVDSFSTITTLAVPDEERERLVVSALAFEARRLAAANCDRLMIKLRSQCTPQATFVGRNCPTVRLLYLYRHAHKVVASFENTFARQKVLVALFRTPILRQGLIGSLKKAIPKDIPAYNTPEFLKKIDTSLLSWFALSWMGVSDTYLKLRTQTSITALRYEDLVATPAEFFLALCEVLTTPVTNQQTAAAVAALSKDSQEGSSIAKKKGRALTEEEKANIDEILALHPALSDPAVVLPGTLMH